MANTLEKDLTGRVVIFKQECLRIRAVDNPFRVDGGFGAKPFTNGSALMGEWLADGEHDRMEGHMVDRYATEDEISAAGEKRAAL